MRYKFPKLPHRTHEHDISTNELRAGDRLQALALLDREASERRMYHRSRLRTDVLFRNLNRAPYGGDSARPEHVLASDVWNVGTSSRKLNFLDIQDLPDALSNG